MRKLALGLCLFISLNGVAGKKKKDIPPAPLPAGEAGENQ
jgi:hypothetical protein